MLIRKIASYFLAATIALASLSPVYAAQTAQPDATALSPNVPAVVVSDNNHVWIRAKLEYDLDDTLYGIDDNAVEFAEKENWTKKDGWFYYKTPVEPGNKIRLINGFSIPTTWQNATSQKGFKIIATVEAAQAFPGDTEWNDNSEACYQKTFDVYKAGRVSSQPNEVITEGNVRLNVVEYQLDENGKEADYQNNKLVTPGEKVSKIIEIQVLGEKGKIWQLIKLAKPTGDASNMLVWAAVGSAAVCVLAVALKKKKN